MTRIPLLIEKLAYSVAQHRKIIRALGPIQRGMVSYFNPYDGVEVAKNNYSPIKQMIHELGHKADILKNKNSDYFKPGDFIEQPWGGAWGGVARITKNMSPAASDNYNIMEEVAANRMGARMLLHTGSPVSEVKDYIRFCKTPFKTHSVGNYIQDNMMNLQNPDGSPPQAIMHNSNKLQALFGAERPMEEMDHVIDTTSKWLGAHAKKNKYTPVISPGVKAKTPVDISYLSPDTQKAIKSSERETISRMFGQNY